MAQAAPAQQGSAKSNAIELKKVKTSVFRVSFPKVFKPEGFNGGDPKYGIGMLFPKSQPELLKDMKRAVANAATEKWGPKEKWPQRLRLPFRDGDEKDDLDGYRGHIYVTATSKQKPGVINQEREYITEESGEFYAGCYARATLIAFAYDTAGNKGVSFSLQNIQKIRNGKPFSGKKKAEDEFESVDRDEGDDDVGSSAGGDNDEFDLG